MSRWIPLCFTVALFTSHAVGEAPRLLPTDNPPQGYPEPWYDDAALRDLCFVGSDCGWAVGDRGVIWQTTTGGAGWERQSATVDCQLSGVHFVDRQQGWIVGGYCHPLTQRSEGVVLRTNDGGRSWERIPGLLLPWLTAVHFTSEQHGVVVGNATAQNPSGAYSTKDGGRTWTSISGLAGSHWAAASFAGAGGLLVDNHGLPASLAAGRLRVMGESKYPNQLMRAHENLPSPPLAKARPSQNSSHDSEREGKFSSADRLTSHWFSAALNSQIGFVGSDRSRLQLTVDGGARWIPVQAPLLGFHVRTMSLVGSSCWLAGTPGSQVLVSTDHSQTWQAVRTGSALPIHKSFFLDDQLGWLIGACGMILATDDGGRSWKSQRGGGKRAALLGVFAHADEVPWEWLTAISAADGFRVHIAVLGQQDQDALLSPQEQRLTDAAMRIGASGEVLTALPVPHDDLNLTAGEIIRRWQDLSPGTLEEVSARLTGLIRTWRPDVVVTTSREDALDLGIRSITTQLVSDACELAASETAFPDQLAAGLSPWMVARPLKLRPRDDDRSVHRGNLLVAGIGRDVAEIATRARQLVGQQDRPPVAWSLSYLDAKAGASSEASLGSNPLGGLPISYGTSARRPRIVADDGTRAKRTQRRHTHARNLLLSDFANPASRLEQADRLLANLDEDFSGNVLWELAHKLTREDDLTTADQVYRKLIARYPRHALSDHALQWLMGYHSSSELRLRQQRQVSSNQPVQLASAELPEAVIQTQIVSSSPAEKAHQVAVQLAKQLESKRPSLYATPQIGFAVASALRADKQPNQAKPIYQRLVSLSDGSVWRGRAAIELALLDPAVGVGLNELCWQCRRFSERPQLDGELSDPCWQAATTKQLTSQPPSAEPLSTVRFGHDDEYFYFAAECTKQQHARYLPSRRPRPRDANLDDLDRIRFKIDIDRDYESWWEFTIDHRGWTHEAVWGDTSWNPDYFVASSADDSQWIIEMAIPLEELAPPEQRSGAAWLMTCERIIPHDRIQTWGPPSVSGSDRVSGALLLIE